MFSEYASKFLPRSRAAPAPLFNGAIPEIDDSDDNYLGPDSDFGASFATSTSQASMSSNEDEDPPSEMLVERPAAAREPVHYKHYKHTTRPGPRHPLNTQQDRPNAHQCASTELSFLARPRPFFFAEKAVAWTYLVLLAFALVTATLYAVSESLTEGKISQIFLYSTKLVSVHALVACFVSFLWLYFMEKIPEKMIRASVAVVPFVLLSTMAYTATSSVHKALLFGSIVLLLVSLLWSFYFYHVSKYMDKAVNLVVCSVDVINECPAGFPVLVAFGGIAGLLVSLTWIVFIAHSLSQGFWGILFAAFLTFMLFWTWEVLNAVIQSVLTLVTARWCSQRTMTGCLNLSIQETFANSLSTACYSSLIAILFRLPLLILPRFLQAPLRSVAGWFQPVLVNISNPLCYPVSIVKRCSLYTAAEEVEKFYYDRRSFQIAKIALTAVRLCCSFVTMFLGWVHADRMNDSSSLYSYMVGGSSFVVGWVVSGTAVNVPSTVVDALLVCYCLKSYTRSELEPLFTNENQFPESSEYHDEP